MDTNKLEELEKQRREVNESIASSQRIKQNLDREIKAIKLQQLPQQLYTIKAIPNDRCRSKYKIGVFTSFNKANKLIPRGGFSYDDYIKWDYLIVTYKGNRNNLDPETVDPSSLSDFPYY